MKEILESKTSKFLNWFYVGFVFLLPVFFLPRNLLSISASKTLLVAFAILISILILIFLKLKDDNFFLPTNLLSLSLFLIPLSYLISSIFSSSFKASFFGRDFIYDNALFTFILFLIIALSVFLLKDIKKTFSIYAAFFISFFIVFITTAVNLFYPELLSNFGYFTSNIINTIGKWNDLSVLAGAILFISILGIEIFKPTGILKKIFYFFFAISVVLIILIGFQLIWFVSLILSLLIFVYLLTFNRNIGEDFKFPYLTLVTFILSFVFIFNQGLVSAFFNSKLQIYAPETTIGISETIRVSKETFFENPIVGFGPGQFSNAWSLFKTSEIYQLEEWNLNFRFSSGYLAQVFVDLGIIGLLAWLFFFVLYLKQGIVYLFKRGQDSFSRFVKISSFVASLFLWTMNIFYIPSVTTLALTFVFTGVFIASLFNDKELKIKKISVSKNPKLGFVYVLILVVMILVIISTLYHYVEKAFAENYFIKSNNSFSNNNLVEAGQLLERAIILDPTDVLENDYAFIIESNMNSLIQNTNINEDEKSAVLKNYLQATIVSRKRAILYDEQNYKNHLNLGNLFSSLIQFKIEGSYEEAKSAYDKALEYSPNNPEIYLAKAKLEVLNNNLNEAKNLITKTLELKANYVDAVFLYSQIQIQEGDLDAGIKTAENAIAMRPFDPNIYFQIGLLRYQNNKFAESIPYFEAAIMRNSFFLNAKYLLGLAYEKVGRSDDAILQFEDLKKLLPDNQNIIQILDKLNKGQSLEQDESNEEELENLPTDEENDNSESIEE